MNKSKSALVFSKLALYHVDPPSLRVPSPSVASLPLELAGGPLHLRPPAPRFACRAPSAGASGVPAYFVAALTNTRFRELADATLRVSARVNGRELHSSCTPSPSPVDPQQTLAHPFRFVCPGKGDVELQAAASFRFEGQTHTNVARSRFSVRLSLEVSMSLASGRLHVQLRNASPHPLLRVLLRTDGAAAEHVCGALAPREAHSCYAPSGGSRVELSWALPFAPRCRQTYTAPRSDPSPPPPRLSVSLCGVPSVVPVGRPFSVTAVVTNNEDCARAYDVCFAPNRYLDRVGRANVRLELGPHGEIREEIHFIALSQGSTLLPALEFRAPGAPPVSVAPRDGVIIAGYDAAAT